MIKANDPNLTSWIEVQKNSDFPIQNIPFGIAAGHGAVTIIGNTVISLAGLHKAGLLSAIKLPAGIFEKEQLNDFIALGKNVTRAVRERLSELFKKDNTELRDNAE